MSDLAYDVNGDPTEHGATGHVVASALGHTSYATTQKHYVQPGTTERVARKKIQALIGGDDGGKLVEFPVPHSRDSDPT